MLEGAPMDHVLAFVNKIRRFIFVVAIEAF